MATGNHQNPNRGDSHSGGGAQRQGRGGGGSTQQNRGDGGPGTATGAASAGGATAHGGGVGQGGDTGRWPAEMASAARDRMTAFGHSAGDTIGENPMISILAGFGIGFGIGFALARLMAPEEESWSSRSMSSVNDAFHDLSHSLRKLPQMTADYVASAINRH